MLVITRKVGESLVIGDDISVTVVKIAGGAVRVGIVAPNECVIVRSELAGQIPTTRPAQKPTREGKD